MIYSLRHPLRFIKKALDLRGEKYAVMNFEESKLRSMTPFRNVPFDRMIKVVSENSVYDVNAGLRWVKLAVRTSIRDDEPKFVVGGQTCLYAANFAALFISGKLEMVYKNREDKLPTIPAAVHQLKTLHYFPASGELETF